LEETQLLPFVVFILLLINNTFANESKVIVNTINNAKLNKYFNEGSKFAKSLDKKMVIEDGRGEVSVPNACQKKLVKDDPSSKKCNVLNHQALQEEIFKDGGLQTNDFKDNDQKILVFVSFSMPKESLKSLLKAAEKYNTTLVLWGLKDNSFKQTQLLMQEYGQNQEGGFEINPQLFKAYQITKVPTFVMVDGEGEINRLSGNVTLEFVTKKLKGEK
jgi:type-F conjugative transfer system pilin assembly protein TrbC